MTSILLRFSSRPKKYKCISALSVWHRPAYHARLSCSTASLLAYVVVDQTNSYSSAWLHSLAEQKCEKGAFSF